MCNEWAKIGQELGKKSVNWWEISGQQVGNDWATSGQLMEQLVGKKSVNWWEISGPLVGNKWAKWAVSGQEVGKKWTRSQQIGG
ncbi:hypothetical protein K435DRAFT_875322 [Dendrothele bispora CBS 962.96]|uniref:Uncharacterized protein n=1 Tax=Dendrothele bispora (strain CBS 962.96) TaxID=1314807 RepID=A0A4S8KUZ1_DENBC|nr:hypothetical protein K435DRAFT_875322 [Dendrothele bispora CBS 962.96]